MIKPDLDVLERLEESLAAEEDAVLEGKKADYPKRMSSYRRELLRLSRYYDQLASALDELAGNDNGLLSEAGLRYVVVLGNRVFPPAEQGAAAEGADVSASGDL